MPVQCPYCQHALSIKNAKPGRYTTACPKCTRKFLLTIPEDPDKPSVVSGMKSERAVFETAAGAVPPSSASKAAPTPSTAESDVTGEWATNASKPLRKTDVPVDTEPATSRLAPSKSLPKTRPLADTTSPGGPSPADSDLDGFLTVNLGPSNAGASASGGAPPSLKIGGYQVLKELGRGGMGAVYLAKQLSLNRNVALKVMKPEWCRNATFVARFTREAYAAAQLTHHNVVQIYDFGEDRGVTYFSMEFVEGETLSGLVRRKKRLEAEEAVGYVLQAARGLKHAHDQSMIHRDIKPDNLLLNSQGVVKVADLGLVKTPETAELDEAASVAASKGAKPSAVAEPLSNITQANVAMGTPAFMSPEQAKDAATVDARADIYSLGCTLYDLITGRPPFEGKTAIEILSKHQTEPVTPPELVVKNVPKALSEIILKMVAKRPDDRYPNLAAVIAAFEDFLGVRSSKPFQNREEYANQLEENARIHRSSPAARLRAWILPGIVASCVVLAILGLFTGKPIFAGGVVGFALMTALADFVVGGIRGRNYLFDKVRQLIFTSSISDLLMALAGLSVILVGLYVFNLFWVWVFLGAAAVCLALGLNVALDRKAELERAEVLQSTERILRTLRLHGLDEDALRPFVCKYSGDHWEEFYEALFGYEPKIEARSQWGIGTAGRARPRFAAWRDPIIHWIDAKLKDRIDAKDKKLLQKIEEKSLEAQGENLVVARRKAQRAAEAMVTVASEMKQSQAASRRDASMVVNHGIAKAMREAATKPEAVLVTRESGLMEERSRGFFSNVLNTLIGPRPRFLVGLALLAGCLFWMKQNGIVSANQLQTAVAVAKSGDIEALKAHGTAEIERARKVEQTRPLKAPYLPKPLLELVSSFGAGAAGLTLLFASFFRGVRMAFFAVPAAAIMILGPKAGLPTIQGIDPSLAPTVAGLAIMGVGLILGRSRD